MSLIKLVIVLVLLLVLSFVLIVAGQCAFAMWHPLEKFEAIIPRAFDGKIDLADSAEFRFVCETSDCESLLPQLPPVDSVKCNAFLWFGACCSAGIKDEIGMEIHIYWRGSRYRVGLSALQCRNPSFDPATDSKSDKFIPCAEVLETREKDPSDVRDRMASSRP